MTRFVFVILAALSAALAHAGPVATDSQLCRSQLELLVAGGKLNAQERDRFEKQCSCLQAREQGEEAALISSCAGEEL